MKEGYLVEGQVQGVGFRWSTVREATRLGLRGAVRNLPDGRVEVCAEGSAEQLGRFRAWLAEGPTGAVVTRVAEAEPRLPVPADGFVIV